MCRICRLTADPPQRLSRLSELVCRVGGGDGPSWQDSPRTHPPPYVPTTVGVGGIESAFAHATAGGVDEAACADVQPDMRDRAAVAREGEDVAGSEQARIQWHGPAGPCLLATHARNGIAVRRVRRLNESRAVEPAGIAPAKPVGASDGAAHLLHDGGLECPYLDGGLRCGDGRRCWSGRRRPSARDDERRRKAGGRELARHFGGSPT